MLRVLLVLPLVFALGLGAPCVRAEEEADDAPPAVSGDEMAARVTAWLKDLRSADFQVRETARTKLRESGLQARSVLESAKDDPDPEVRRTVRAILARAPLRPTTIPAAVRPGDFRGLGRLGFEAKGEPLGAVLERVGKALGGRIEAPADLLETSVDLHLSDVPCFDLLHAVAQKTGTRYGRPFDRNGVTELVRREDAAVEAPRAAAGPMQVRVLEVSATRTFGLPAPPRYALKLQLEWAPFVQLVQYDRPNVDVARDPDGRSYRATADMGRSASYGVGGSSTYHATTVHIEPGEADCRTTLGVLEVSVPIRTLRFDEGSVEIDDFTKLPVCVGADGRPASPGSNESVLIHAVEEAPDGRGQWVVDFSATLTAEAAQRSVQAWLVEADGTLLRVNVYGGRSIAADGTLRITGRGYRGSRDGKPRGVRVSWFRREEQGMLRFRLTDIPLR